MVGSWTLYGPKRQEKKGEERKEEEISNQIALNTQALAAKQAQCKWNGGLGVLTE